MPSQFIVVSFPQARMVLSGGNELGGTNHLLPINAGTHTFTLDGPQDYDPAELEIEVVGTSVAKPLKVTFVPRPEGPVEPSPSVDLFPTSD